MEFLQAIDEIVNKFKELEKKPIRIISHLDSDGIAAASILIKAFQRENLKFVVSIVRQLDKEIFNELKRENYEIYFFVDLGSGYLKEIEKNLGNNTIFVLDHHKFEDYKTKVNHVNPNMFNLDENEISGAGVVYLFAKKLNEKNKDMAYIALIGAIGDMQEKNGFYGYNKLILEDAVNSKKIEVKRGLSMFGMQTKPLHKVLEYNTEPYIPGVTGNEEGAINFLTQLGINIKEKGRYKKLIHLDQEDMKKLVTGIILKRLGSEENPEDVLGPIYLLRDEEEESATKDAKEFSTLLNSCGRLNQSSLGIGTCLGNKKTKEEAINLLNQYKKEIINALNWFYANRKGDKIIEKNNYVIINAEDNIRNTLIGTLATIISKSNLYEEGTVIIALAHTLGDETKISARVYSDKFDFDLRDLILKATKGLGDGFAGGHSRACGALIPQEKEIEFINKISELLSKLNIKKTVS